MVGTMRATAAAAINRKPNRMSRTGGALEVEDGNWPMTLALFASRSLP
jgi:hypothetical protein